MTAARISLVISLPPDFRVGDFLAFHQRDALGLAERVRAGGLEKGLVWERLPACLALDFEPGLVTAELSAADQIPAAASPSLAVMVQRMLALNQPVAAFEAASRTHPLLGPLITAHPGLRVPATATPFEAMSWAIIGQQISVGAAVSVRRNLIRQAGVKTLGGIACFPDATAVLALGESGLRQAGFSASKARTLASVCAQILAGDLPLDDWLADPEPACIREQLLAIRGIGPWTVNCTLLRGFGCVDGSLHGDAAVRRALQRLLGSPGKISEAVAEAWLAGFSPWRALVAAHLWASGGVVA